MKKYLVKNMTRLVLLLILVTVGLRHLHAHTVVWFKNTDGSQPTNAMVLVYGRDSCGSKDYDYINVKPSTNEPCTVVVNITSVNSPVISTHFEDGINTANSVWIEVDVEGLGPDPVTATVSGEWHATGLDEDGTPDPLECDATNPNPFTVTVLVMNRPRLTITRDISWGNIHLDPGDPLGNPRTLHWTSSLLRPMWVNVGVGSSFTLKPVMSAQFFKVDSKLGAPITGTITDPNLNPLPGLSIGLPYGGPTTFTDFGGNYMLPWMPRGFNLISISKPVTYVDPATSSNRTENVAVNVVVPVSNNVAVAQMKVNMGVDAGPGTNGCNCTPWCAIGFGSLNGGQTPVYYSGGAFSPTSGPADCDPPQVTVTPPSGTPYSITAGSDLHQNSGPNPASGTWTVTTTVCGRSKSCSVTVP